MEHWSYINQDTKEMVLRHFTYPKEGSEEWVVSGDSIEFRIIGSENETFLISDLEKVKLIISKSVKRLDMTFRVEERVVSRSMILLEIEGAVDVARYICKHIAKENTNITPVISDRIKARYSNLSYLTKRRLLIKSIPKACYVLFLIFHGIIVFDIVFFGASATGTSVTVIIYLLFMRFLSLSLRGITTLKRQELILGFSFKEEMEKYNVKEIPGDSGFLGIGRQYCNEKWFIAINVGRIVALRKDYIQDIRDFRFVSAVSTNPLVSNPHYVGTMKATVFGVDGKKIRITLPTIYVEELKKWFFNAR